MQSVPSLSDVAEADSPAKWELRAGIAGKVGRRQSLRSRLNKGTLNSIHAYLTGSFAVPKRVVNCRTAPYFARRSVILNGVIWMADLNRRGIRYEHIEDVGKIRPVELNKPALEQLARVMNTREDKRDWL